MDNIKKTFGLILCDKHDFLRQKGKVIKTEVINHQEAIGFFLEHYSSVLLNKTIITFCFEDNQQWYGYEYNETNASPD